MDEDEKKFKTQQTDRIVEVQETTNRLQEHFWVTATTIGVHGFLMSKLAADVDKGIIFWVSTSVWFLAIFRIAELAAARPVDVPSRTYETKHYDTLTRKCFETIWNFRLLYKRLGFIVFECKGALFYVFLVSCSLCGAWVAKDIIGVFWRLIIVVLLPVGLSALTNFCLGVVFYNNTEHPLGPASSVNKPPRKPTD